MRGPLRFHFPKHRFSLNPQRSTLNRCGFTLLELLVVIGIIILVLAFSVPAITGLSKSNNLTTGGRVVANLLTVARSEAINRRMLIRFEIATTWPSDPASAYRKIILVQHDLATGSDTALANWQTLPTGIVFQDPSIMSGEQLQNPALVVGGQSVTTYYIEFLPTGALNINPASSPITFHIVPGIVPGNGTPTPTSTTNWCNVSVDALVGRVAVARP